MIGDLVFSNLQKGRCINFTIKHSQMIFLIKYQFAYPI